MIFTTALVLRGLILLRPLLKDILSIVMGKPFRNESDNTNIKKRN
ncbi:BlyA family holin [Borreliella burgdorferi]|nr:BlyA family holin [Borreliella burgdorferi]